MAVVDLSTLKGNRRPTGEDEITIVFTGKSGAGKSTLITNILHDRAETEVELSPNPITEQCEQYFLKRNRIKLNVVDTAGLIAGQESSMSKTLHDIATYTKCKADLLVYCLNISPGSKFVDGNPAMMKSLQRAFGKEVWKHCIVVLTFSNYAWDRLSKGKDPDVAVASYLKYVKEYAALFEDHLIKVLRVSGIKVATIFDKPLRVRGQSTIVAVPAGVEFTDEVLPNIQVDETTRWMGVIRQEMIESCREERKAAFKRYAGNWSPWLKGLTASAVVVAVGAVAIGALVML